MGLKESKDKCNYKYIKLIQSIEKKENLNLIHSALIDVAETLLRIGTEYPNEMPNCQKKAISLAKLAKELNSSSKHEDIYFKLTGTKLEGSDDKNVVDLEGLRRQLNQSKPQTKNPEPGLTSVKKIDSVFDEPRAKDDKDKMRPQTLDSYVGQDRVKLQLKEAIEAAKIKGQPLEHILLFGSAGLGKTSLSKIVAHEMHSRIIVMSGPTIKDVMSFVEVIRNVKYGDIVFIDEIHRINTQAAEAIYTVMEDFELSYIEKDKDNTRNVHLKLPKFTLIGATTHSGLLEKPMRDRFTLQFKLEPYSKENLAKIATDRFNGLGLSIDVDAALEIGKRSRGVPRRCNQFVLRLYDRALVRSLSFIDKDFVLSYFDLNGIDEKGLDELDINYLMAIYDKFGNKAVGIDNLSSVLGEGKNIIENQIEPYLLYLGLIQITSSGRMLTTSGVDYIVEKKHQKD